MRNYIVSREILKNENWGRMCIIASSRHIHNNDLAIDAKEGKYYIFNDCGELMLATKKEYEDFNHTRKDILYHLTELQTITVFLELVALLKEPPTFKGKYIFLITPGIIRGDKGNFAHLHSFRIDRVMTINDFAKFFADTLLDEFDQFVAAAGSKECTDARNWFLNRLYFPMKRKRKSLMKLTQKIPNCTVDPEHLTEMGMEELEDLCAEYELYDDDTYY